MEGVRLPEHGTVLASAHKTATRKKDAEMDPASDESSVRPRKYAQAKDNRKQNKQHKQTSSKEAQPHDEL